MFIIKVIFKCFLDLEAVPTVRSSQEGILMSKTTNKLRAGTSNDKEIDRQTKMQWKLFL